MAQTLPREIRLELDQLKEEVGSIKAMIVKRSTLPLPAWLSTIFQGVTLTILIAAAFWFGSLGNAVARTETAVEELRKSVQELKESRVETNSRLKAIEDSKVEMNGRLNAFEAQMNTRLEAMNTRLKALEDSKAETNTRLRAIELRLTNIEKKLEP